MYNCKGVEAEGISVKLELLEMGPDFAPTIKAIKPTSRGGFRAGLGELAKMKATTYMARDEAHDCEDFEFVVKKMIATGEGFEGVELEEDDRQDMQDTAKECGQVVRDQLKELINRAGH